MLPLLPVLLVLGLVPPLLGGPPGPPVTPANGTEMRTPTPADLAGLWIVTELAEAEAPADPPLTLEFIGDQVAGFSGCNTFHASVLLAGAGLTFGPLSQGPNVCGAEEMAVEMAFIRAMQRAAVADIGPDGTLTLSIAGIPMIRARRG